MLTALSYIKRNWFWILCVLLFICGAGYWYYTSTSQPEVKPATQRPQVRTLEKTLSVPGVIDADNKVQLRFAAGGLLTRLSVQEGDLVKKWQTLAVIDRRTLEKQLQKDLIVYSKERNDWDQVLDDTKDRAIPKKEERQKSNSQLDLNTTVLDVEIRDIAIKNTVLTAPFAGIITKSPTTSPGVTLSAADYFELVDPDSLVFKAEVDELDIGQVTEGQKAEISLDAFSDETHTASVSGISFTSAQASTGTVFIVELSIPDQLKQKLRLGMNGEATILLEKKEDALSIPLDALKDREDTVFVDVLTDQGEVVQKEIEVGLRTDDFVEVLSGLTENDAVVVPE